MGICGGDGDGFHVPTKAELALRTAWVRELRRRGLTAVIRLEEIARDKARRGLPVTSKPGCYR